MKVKNVLAAWAGTIAASYGINFINDIRIFKTVSDEGYKINLNTLITMLNKTSHISKTSIKTRLIPGYNIASAIKNTTYEDKQDISLNFLNRLAQIDKQSALTCLSLMGSIEIMDKSEYEEYSKNPTAIRALGISLKSYAKEKTYKNNVTNLKKTRIK